VGLNIHPDDLDDKDALSIVGSDPSEVIALVVGTYCEIHSDNFEKAVDFLKGGVLERGNAFGQRQLSYINLNATSEDVISDFECFSLENEYLEFQVTLDKKYSYLYQDKIELGANSAYTWRIQDAINEVTIDVGYEILDSINKPFNAENWVYNEDQFINKYDDLILKEVTKNRKNKAFAYLRYFNQKTEFIIDTYCTKKEGVFALRYCRKIEPNNINCQELMEEIETFPTSKI